MILLSAHYDSYFDGFQDDNAAVAMMLGIARALVKGGYKPAHTLVFSAMAAEEWGIIDSKYDWSTGAYNQVQRMASCVLCACAGSSKFRSAITLPCQSGCTRNT